MPVNISEYKAFVDHFLQRYLEHGFGTLTKREIDILMMHLITEYSDLSEASNYELSMLFKMTETRVKNLRYEAKLRHITDQETYVRKAFLKLLTKAKFETRRRYVLFSIEDNYLKSAIQARLKQFGSFADNSFNSEIVKISEDSFAELLASFYTPLERKTFEKKMQKLLQEEDAVTFKTITKKFLKGAAENAGGKVVDLGVNYFGANLRDYRVILDKIISFFN